MPYDELGNFISDSEALDTMRYELAKKGNMPLRPDGSDVPYVMSEVPQRYVEKQKTPPASSATNFAQAVADKLGISALPQALLAMGTAFPAEVAKGMGYGDASKAMRYEPTSRAAQDVLSGIDEIPRAVTGSHMGFGPLPETWVSGLGRVSPSDVRVMGANARRIGNEIVELPADFSNAQSGFKRQNVFGEPTLGVRAESAASDIGDVLARRQAAGKSSIPGVPESLVPETNMYAVRPVNAGQLLKETDMPTIRYVEANPKIHTVGYRLEEDILPYTGSDYPNTTRAEYYKHIFENDMDIHRAYDQWASNKYMEMFPDAPSVDIARRAYSNQGNLVDRSQDQMRMMTEFANSPEANAVLDQKATARDLAVKEYNEVKNTPKSELKTDEAKELHRAKVDELELELLKNNYAPELSSEEFRKRISIPSADEYLRRATAARNFMLGEFRNDIAKYFGTSQGPQMELAKRGVTIPPKQELMERAKQISQGGADYRELMKKRSEAGFNPEGEMQPLVVQKEAELAEQQKQLDELNTKQNSLREQHRLQMPEEPDPARNPTEIGAQYRALRNPMTAIIEKMTKNKKQLENFRLANAYELVNDMGFIQKPASEWRNTIPYEQRHFFPDLFAKRENGEYKIPDNAPINHVASAATKKLGIDFLAEQYTQAILDGRVPIDEKGKPTVPVDKFIEQMTKPRLKEEELQNVEASRAQVRLNDYAQRTLASTDPALRFKNASVVELTKDNPMDVIRRQVSFDGMVLDNCVAGTDAPHPGINPFTNDRYSYSYPVDPATGRNRGERARNSSYMESIHQGDQRYASLRDNTTGIPVVNINMHRTAESGSAAPKYNIQYVSGYQNDKIDKKYTDDVRDYLNARVDIIQGSGRGLDKWGIYDLTSPGGQTAASRALGVPETALGSFDLPRFVTEKDLRELAKQQPIGDTHADLVAARDRLSQEMRQLINEYGAGAPEAQDVANQLQDLEARLSAISTQVRNAPNDLNRPSLFRRMTTEALTNAAQQEGNVGNVRATVENLIDTDSYGLRELWSDDYDFYPIALRNFTNAVRNNADLPMTLTNRTDMSSFSTQMRDRLARFAINIRDFNHMERELFTRELDNYAESNINQMADNLDPENNLAGLEEIEDTHPGTIQYLRDIETRRRGNDTPQVETPALQAPTNVPRDIAEQVIPRNHLLRDELVQQMTERLNNSVRNLPEDRETLQEALAQYQRDPLDIPGALEMVLPPEGANESRRIISNYLIQHIQSRLGNAAPAVAAPRYNPRDIALSVAGVPQENIEGLTDQIENVIRHLDITNQVGDRARLEQFRNTFSDPNRLPQSIIDYTHDYQDLERIANYLIEHVDYRLGNQAPAQTSNLNRTQIEDVINREVDRQLTILNLIPANQERFRQDMATILENRTPDQILNSLEETRTRYNNEQQEGLSGAVNTVLNELTRMTNAARREPQAAPARSTAVMNAVTDLSSELFRSFEAHQFDVGDLTSTLHALDARNFDHPRLRTMSAELGAPISDQVQEDVAQTLRLLLEGRNINVPVDIFADEIPGAEPAGNGPEAYRDMHTNEVTGSRRAYDEVMQAERMTPGAINEAISRTDGRAMHDPEVMRFYNMDTPAGIRQLNTALRRYMEGNGFDHPPRPVENAIDELERRYPDDDMANVEPEHAIEGAINAIRDIDGPAISEEIQALVENLHNDDIRFDREPEQFLTMIRTEAQNYDGHNQAYSDALVEFADTLEDYLRNRAQRRRGHKRGGIIRKETGGRVEPSAPSPSVNDQSKPVTPPKRIINPDAPEFKDLFIRERANRTGSSGGGSGPSPADIKQMMNPRNINYNAGGNVSIDEMRYELLRK